MNQQELIPHLFRTEFSRIVTALCKRFGIEHMEVAEDIASETFLMAIETWSYKGIPENPAAWLYTVAKNKTKNHISRNKLFAKRIGEQSKESIAVNQDFEMDWSVGNIADSQLQMLFAICHPSIPREAQIGLALRILCGFGIDEIATAFLTNKETINKRLFRAKEKLRLENVTIEFPTKAEINSRLEAVLTTLYLLFNEGYYSESHDSIVRKDLCLEAMRLTYLLIDYEPTNQPAVNALFSLMCFHSSRFDARKNEGGELILYEDQDETLWNPELISRGAFHLHQASQGTVISKFHLEAGIAYWHTIKAETKEKWPAILQLYDQLIQIERSPMAALNRAFALSKVHGKEVAISEVEKLDVLDNHYYYTLLGELYRDRDNQKSKANFQKALTLAKTQADKQIIQKKIDKQQPL